MKRVYLSAFAMSVITAGAFAQTTVNPERMTPIKESSQLTPPTNKPTTSVGDESKALNILWTEDFSGGALPLETANGQWVVGGTNGAYWSIGDNPHPLSAFGWTDMMTTEYLAWDSYNEINEPAGSFATTMVDGEAVSPTITLAGNTNSVGIQFDTEAYYCCNYQYRPFGVSASMDNGATWSDTLEFDFGVDRNESTQAIAQPMTVLMNLDAIVPAGPSSTFKIKFVWNGMDADPNGQYNTHYFWLLDDIAIYEIPNNDISLDAGWHGDFYNDWEYSQLPIYQSTNREMVPVVIVSNTGSQAQTVDVTCDIQDGTSSVSNTVINHTIAPGVTDTLWFNTGFMPAVLGTYSTTFSVPADDVISNDIYVASDLNVTNFQMGHDYGSTDSYGWDPTATDPTNAQEPHSYGNRYIPVIDQNIYAVDVVFETGTTDGLYVLARIQEVNVSGSVQDPMTFITQIDHTTVVNDNGFVTTLVLPSPVTLFAGITYLIDILKVDGTTTEIFNVGGSELNGEDDDFSTVNYGPFGANNAINYYSGWGYAPYVRANFDPSLGLAEASLDGVSVYPNPSEGIVTVTNTNNEDNLIEVYTVSGKVVLTKEASSTTSINLGAKGSGVYIVKVSNANGSAVKRIVIK